tara:strand:+ start:3859 stop:4428 length:570 start_codon:yes stop_codon:yes gene_type:complete
MFRIKIWFFYFLCVYCFSTISIADNYNLIRKDSFLNVKATYLVFFSINGYFKDFEGDIKWDKANLSNSFFKGKAKIADLTTGISAIDKQLYSSRFFDIEQYPYIYIESTKIKHLEGNLYEVEAFLTVKNITQKITERLTVFEDESQPGIVYFSATIKLKRNEFNLTNNLTHFIVDNTVKVSLLFKAEKK